jgi:chloramphenicol 3-O-phosphotransferase
MSKVIFLNGCAAAGKTLLAKEIQNLSEEKFLYVGIDALFGAIPKKLVGFDKQAEEGFRYVVDPKTSVLTEIRVSPYAGLVFSCLPKVVKLLADNGLNLIFDECNFVKKSDTKPLIDDYKTLFSGHGLYMVNVRIQDLETLEQREKSRGDRVMGMGRLFYQSEKKFSYNYDSIVYNDTPESLSSNVIKILKFLKENEPWSFAKNN